MQPIMNYLEIKRRIEEYDYESVLSMQPVLEAIKPHVDLQTWIQLGRVNRKAAGTFHIERFPGFGVYFMNEYLFEKMDVSPFILNLRPKAGYIFVGVENGHSLNWRHKHGCHGWIYPAPHTKWKRMVCIGSTLNTSALVWWTPVRQRLTQDSLFISQRLQPYDIEKLRADAPEPWISNKFLSFFAVNSFQLCLGQFE